MRTELYAEALVEQLHGLESTGQKDRAEEVHAELAKIGEDLPKAIAEADAFIKSGIKLDGVNDRQQSARILEGMPEIQRLRRLEEDLKELGYYGSATGPARKRTTKAAAAPVKAVPPAADLPPAAVPPPAG